MSAVDAGLTRLVRDRLVADGAVVTRAGVAGAVVAAGVHGDARVREVADALVVELTGVGPLTALLADPAVTDVVVTAPRQVWVDRGAGLRPARVDGFPDEAAVRRLAQRLAAQAGRRLDDAQPFVDVRLPDGLRLHAVLPPVAVGCTQLSLRVPRRRVFTLEELVAAGTLDDLLAAALRSVVRARLPFLVTGGTGSGKTTVLSTLLGVADPRERVVLVEELGELRPDLPHVVRLQTRPANAEGAGEVTLQTLVRQCLRMRPDRIVVGEARGAELVDLLTALNTGHDGGCATVHANAAGALPARVEALAALAGLSRAAAASLLGAAVQVVVHVARRGALRLVTQIGVLVRGPSGEPVVKAALRRDGGATAPASGAPALRRLLVERGVDAPW